MSERYSPPEPEDTFTALMKGFELSDEARQDIAAMNDFEISTAVDAVAFDPILEMYYTPVDDAVQRLIDAYIDHLTAYGAGPITPAYYNQVIKNMNVTDIPRLGDLEPGEWLATDGACTIIDEYIDDEGDALVSVTEIPDGESIVGQFAGVVIRDVMPLDIDAIDENTLMTSLCIALANCRLVDASGEPALPFEGEVQFIPITVPNRPRFARYIVPQTEEEEDE